MTYQPAGPRKWKGFTLLELLLVLTVLAVLVVITVSRLTKRRMCEYEVGAIVNMKTISIAEGLYYSRYGSYTTLAQLQAADLIDISLAQATTPENAVSGYYFIHTLGPDDYSTDSWCCIARPARWGVTGSKNFKMEASGSTWYNKTEGGSDFTNSLSVW